MPKPKPLHANSGQYANYQRISGARKRLGKPEGLFFQKPMRKGERVATIKLLENNFLGKKFSGADLPRRTSLTTRKMNEAIARIEKSRGAKPSQGANRHAIVNIRGTSYYDYGMRIARRVLLKEFRLPQKKAELVSRMLPHRYNERETLGLRAVLEYVKKFGPAQARADFKRIYEAAKNQRVLSQLEFKSTPYVDMFVNPLLQCEALFKKVFQDCQEPAERAERVNRYLESGRKGLEQLLEKQRSSPQSAEISSEISGQRSLINSYELELEIIRLVSN